jgi:TonB family protein
MQENDYDHTQSRGELRSSVLPALLLLLTLCAAEGRAAESSGPPPPSITLPVASCSANPEYPSSERASGRSGTELLRLHLDEHGQAQSVDLAQGLGEPFDALALKAGQACTFTPALKDGKPVPAIVELSIRFVAPPLPATLTGVVVDSKGKPMAGATVEVGEVAVETDPLGRFRLEVPGEHPLNVSVRVERSGFEPRLVQEELVPGEEREVKYVLSTERVIETVVVGSRLLPGPPKVDPTPQVSHFEVLASEIDRTPGALEDVARVVQDLPGVAGDPDLLATFSVRGGGPEETLFFLDGIPLSNAFHLGGFATIFDPTMVTTADFYAGDTPGRYEPALSGVLDVHYASGEAKTPRVWTDVSMQTAKARVDMPTGIDGLSVTLSARRSYFELYFLGLKAFNIVGQDYVAPDLSEYLARVNFHRARHELTATFLYAQDGLSFLTKPGEQALLNVGGGLVLRNDFGLFSLKERMELGGGSELSSVFAFTRDFDHTSVTTGNAYVQDAQQNNVFASADLTLKHSARLQTRGGLQYQRWDLGLTGQISDTRDQPPWGTQPIVDRDLPFLNIQPRVLRNILAAYVEGSYRPLPSLTLSASARGDVDISSKQWTESLRLAASQVLPTATVLKASASVASSFVMDPLALDATYGNPALAPQGTKNLIVGLEQPLPFHALVRLEGYGKWLSSLTVNPDSAAGLQARLLAQMPAYASVGSGHARGVDGLFAGQTGPFAYGLAAGFLRSERDNPLATAGPAQYRAPWDQRFTTAVHLSYSPDTHWIFSGRLAYHLGRPYTPVNGFTLDPNGRYAPVFGAVNSAQYPYYFEASLRAERHFRLGPWRAAWYVEVLNVTNAKDLFAYVYDEGNPATGQLPQRSSFNQLPIRPFAGVRAEY